MNNARTGKEGRSRFGGRGKPGIGSLLNAGAALSAGAPAETEGQMLSSFLPVFLLAGMRFRYVFLLVLAEGG